MFQRTFLATAIGTALLLGAAGSASALSITSGNYKITLDNYDAGTLYTSTTPGVICTSIADCNAAGHVQGNGTTVSDTAGILSIAAIQNLNTGVTEYIRGTASTIGGMSFGPYLTGVFGGLQDQYAERIGTFTQTNSTGGFFNIYSNTTDWSPGLSPTGAGINLDSGIYSGITSGSLFLSGIFAAGAILTGDTTSTYTSMFNNNSIGGSGQGFLDFTGGSAYNFFHTSSLTNANGGKNDAYITVTYDDVNQVASSIGWTVKSTAQISGQVIPEPGTLALAGLALLAAGMTARRRRS